MLKGKKRKKWAITKLQVQILPRSPLKPNSPHPMESMTTSEIIDRINEIEAVQGKHLPVRVECSSQAGLQAVVEVKYRSSLSPSNAMPYIALIGR